MQEVNSINQRPDPLVTIGLPVYNGARHLGQALDCLRGQSYRNIEIIVSDNASTDGTAAICEAAASQDSRVRYLRHRRNGGPYWNFAFVLHQASGPLFMWAAHDDVWDTDWVGELVRGFAGDAGIAFGKVRKIGPADGAQKNYPDLVFEGGRMARLARYILADEGMGKANLIYGLHNTASLRERALPVLNSGRKIAGLDMLIVFRCLEKGPAVSVPSVWFSKRVPLAGPRNWGGRRFLRALLMWDRLSYVWACLSVAEGLATKVMIGALLPVKYVTAALWSLRAIVAGDR